MKQLLSELVKIYSVSRHEGRMAAFIASHLKKQGISSKNLGYNTVVCQIPGKDSTKAIIFNGHTDTVPAGDSWKTNPFTLEDQKDRYVGLGASDMKSGLAIILELASQFNKTTPPVDLWFCFAGNEEINGMGSRLFAKYFKEEQASNYREYAAVIGEPTDCNFIGIGHRGNKMFEITVHGQSGHGSRPHEIKVHAVYEAVKIMDNIQKSLKTWKRQYRHKLLGEPSVTVTSVRTDASKSFNKFPEVCQFVLDVRTTPGFHDKIDGLLERLIKPVKDASLKEIAECSPPASVEVKDPIVVAAKKVLKKHPLQVFPGATDMSFLSEQGIPCIIYGPGTVAAMHVPNEYVLKRNLTACRNAYKKLIVEYARKS